MKVTILQIDQAFGRAVSGESVRAIARSLGVTEGCLRFHFRKGKSPKYVRGLAYAMFQAQQARAGLTIAEQKAVDRITVKARAGVPKRLAPAY